MINAIVMLVSNVNKEIITREIATINKIASLWKENSNIRKIAIRRRPTIDKFVSNLIKSKSLEHYEHLK